MAEEQREGQAEGTNRFQPRFYENGIGFAVNGSGVIFMWVREPDRVLEFHPDHPNYGPLLDWCQKRVRRLEREETGTQLPLASKLASLEQRVDILWTELFTVYLTEMNSQVNRERTTLAGKVRELCRLAGIEPQDAPWSL